MINTLVKTQHISAICSFWPQLQILLVSCPGLPKPLESLIICFSKFFSTVICRGRHSSERQKWQFLNLARVTKPQFCPERLSPSWNVAQMKAHLWCSFVTAIVNLCNTFFTHLSLQDRSCSVPRTYSTSGDRSFAAAGTRVWNSLPSNLRDEKLVFGTSGACWKLTGLLLTTAQCEQLFIAL